jgi:MFS transporter, DHA2 family, multidrug resistance protein
VRRQRRARDPLIDLRLFASRGFTWGSVAFGVVSFAMAGVLFTITPYLQIVRGADAQLTGVELLPMIGAMLASAAIIDKSAARLNVRWVITAGLLLCGGGLAILSLSAEGGAGYWVTAVALAVFGLGLGLSLPLSADAVLATLPPGQTGAGSALNRGLQRIAVALSPAVLGSVLASTYRRGLPATAPAVAQGGIAGAHATGSGALIGTADHAYAHGMALAAVVSIAVLAVGAVLTAMFLPLAPSSGGRGSSRRHRDGVDDQVDGPPDHAFLPGDAEAGPVEGGGGAKADRAAVRSHLGDPDAGLLGYPARGD